MPNRWLVGRCGIYCGYCEIYRAYKDSPKLRAELAQRYGCSPGDIICSGCQMVHARGWRGDPKRGYNCKIRECLGDKGFKFCYECPAIKTCRLLIELASVYILFGVDLNTNLQIIRDGKIKEWLSEQDARWRCGNCEKPIILSQKIDYCHHCGRALIR